SMPNNLADKYEIAGSLPVDIDLSELKRMGVEVVSHSLLEDNDKGLVRHNCAKVAKIIYCWYKRKMKGNKSSRH
ncbi:hypothetical protein IJ670_04965, partial [bacterium]|nr:hypothetical protein [bacterium]